LSILTKEQTQMKIPRSCKARQQWPDLFDWAAETERRSASHQVRSVAWHFRVTLATAATLITLAGFSNREDGE
jgi:hypothetical protein